jgi:hypothetical protein
LDGEFEKLLEPDSANDIFPPQLIHHRVPFDRNHSELVKFYSRYDPCYSLIERRLQEFSKAAVGVVQARFETGGTVISLHQPLLFYSKKKLK